MNQLYPYDWDEEKTASMSLLHAYDVFESACQLQETAEDIFIKAAEAYNLENRAADIRNTKNVVWLNEHSLLGSGLNDPYICLGFMGIKARNSFVEWRAERLERKAQRKLWSILGQ